MAYSLPELVLVGTAQNLVLACSTLPEKEAVIDCYGPNDRDLIEAGTYNRESTW